MTSSQTSSRTVRLIAQSLSIRVMPFNSSKSIAALDQAEKSVDAIMMSSTARRCVGPLPPSQLSVDNADFRLYELLKNNSHWSWQAKALFASKRGSLQSALACTDDSRGAWWRMTGSNRRPPACKAGALPAELIPHDGSYLVWWVWLDSNQRPPPYQDGALTD